MRDIVILLIAIWVTLIFTAIGVLTTLYCLYWYIKDKE